MLDTSLTCWTPPIWDASPYVLHPHSLVGFLVHLYVLGISAYYMRNIPLMLGVWGCSPYVGSFEGHLQSVNLWCMAVHPLGVS